MTPIRRTPRASNIQLKLRAAPEAPAQPTVVLSGLGGLLLGGGQPEKALALLREAQRRYGRDRESRRR